MNNPRSIDVTLFGATGFVGRLTAVQLYRRCREEGLVLALAGRNRERLERLLRELPRDEAVSSGDSDGDATVDSPPLLRLASSDDPDALRRLAAESRVICSTVGPYARFGSPLVAACVEAGTDYCDLTGEVQWIRRMIDDHDATAKGKGARIVHACGFDSVPSDLGVLLAQERHRELYAAPAGQLRLRLTRGKGGVSRGTLESMMLLMMEAKKSGYVRELLKDPKSLEDGWTPPGSRRRRRWRDPTTGNWMLPFLMEEINRRVVHRSNSLFGYRYGAQFEYGEFLFLGRGLGGFFSALFGRLGIALARLMLSFGPSRWLISRTFFPKPGEGPRVALEGGGYFEARIEKPESGEALITVSADRDPGYGATSIMLAESAILLAKTAGEGRPGGVLTPAVALGAPLAERLTRAGVRFGAHTD